MDPPLRYPYDPHWRLIAFELALCAAILAATLVRWLPLGLGLAGAGLFGALTLLLIVRRLVFKRFIELGADALLLPTGFLRARRARIAYSDITRVADGFLPLTAIICIATEKRRYEILSTMMPDAESFMEVRDFILQQAPQPEPEAEPTTQGRLRGLMGITGFMMVIGALPVGIALMLQDYKFHQDWQWAIILAAVVAIAVAAVGGLLLGIASYWHRHAYRDRCAD